MALGSHGSMHCASMTQDTSESLVPRTSPLGQPRAGTPPPLRNRRTWEPAGPSWQTHVDSNPPTLASPERHWPPCHELNYFARGQFVAGLPLCSPPKLGVGNRTKASFCRTWTGKIPCCESGSGPICGGDWGQEELEGMRVRGAGRAKSPSGCLLDPVVSEPI
jgi:hypothetical protein